MIEQIPPLKQQVEEYQGEAFALRQKREDLRLHLKEVMRTDIIPFITPMLPEGYSLNPDKSQVYDRSCTGDAVPTGFDLDLRLEFEGKPVHFNNGDDKLAEIQNGIEPKLRTLAELYGISSVMIMGAPLDF